MMPEDNIDSMVRKAIGLGHPFSGACEAPCPSDEALAEFNSGALTDALKRESIIAHISKCDFCFSKIAYAKASLSKINMSKGELPGKESIRKAKLIPNTHNRNHEKGNKMKRHVSLIIASVFFILSFVYRRYFLQFLVACAIFGFKWVMDTGGSKSLIMIYDNWLKTKKDNEKTNSRF